MISWLDVLSFIQSSIDYTKLWCGRGRRQYLLPLAHSGGRDMILLRSGGWIDNIAEIPDEDIRCRYDAEQGHITSGSGPLKRHQWLSVSQGTRDMSDFFADLRTTVTLTSDELLMLYTHQTGHYPKGVLSVVQRDGTEVTVYFGVPAPPSKEAITGATQLDYIR